MSEAAERELEKEGILRRLNAAGRTASVLDTRFTPICPAPEGRSLISLVVHRMIPEKDFIDATR